MKNICDRCDKIMLKYIIDSDFQGVLKLKKKFLFFTILMIAFAFYNLKILGLDIVETFHNILGLNADWDKNILIIIVLLSHVFIAIYLEFLLLDKDFKWNTELLFLRVDLKKWYFFKSISTILMTSFIKIIQFLLFIILLQIPIKTIWLYCLKLLVTDIIYLYIIQQIAFTFYVLISIKRNYYIGLLLLFICMFFRIPINIVNLMNFLKIFIIITIILIVINYIIFQKTYISCFERKVK